MPFLVKIRTQKRDFQDFRYRYSLPQKSKNEYIFAFLRKCIPITEILEIARPFRDFITVFLTFLKFSLKCYV